MKKTLLIFMAIAGTAAGIYSQRFELIQIVCWMFSGALVGMFAHGAGVAFGDSIKKIVLRKVTNA
jgi:hypothetical protein